MLTHIKGILDQNQLATARKLIAAGKFSDGSSSAGMAARRVKHNEELILNQTHMSDLNNLVMNSLVNHPVYRSAALPLRIAAPYYAHYTKGMSYGEHVDDPIMGQGSELYRSDISITIFLNSPDDYDGGELVIQTSFGEQQIKLPAGDAILYPSSSTHRVAEVSRGERLVAVSWVQSLVQEPEKRALLHDMNQARETLLRDKPDADETRQVNQSYINLVRMWSDI
ncbi:MAG: Fe2+-dependent dioxygenase [Gammaproteobacteria bacterium]|jgi:PKHD-type hydroxylase|nr:Fe2+-dependent dioxygenase [Gammaproteobacteria bacterium]